MLSSMSMTILMKMVGLNTSSQIWKTLKNYFGSHNRAQINKIKVQLKTPKNNQNIHTCLLEIKKTVDSLVVIEAPISIEEHIKVMVDNLSNDYNSFVTVVMSRLNPNTVEDIEALLLA